MAAKKKAARKKPKKASKKAAKKGTKKVAGGPVGDSAEVKSPTGWKKELVVDYWATSMHGAEIGVAQTLRYRAESRGKFTEEMDVHGVVKYPEDENKEDEIFATREDWWKEADLVKKHLLIRWFRGKDAKTHVGTIENMLVISLRKSVSANDDLLEFRCTLPGYKYDVIISQERTKFAKLGENFTMELKMPDKSWEIFEFDEKRLTIGSDWEIKDQRGEVVAFIDEKKLNVGGKFVVSFFDEGYYKDKQFLRAVLLFTMALKYKDDLIKQVKKLRKRLKKDKGFKLAGINRGEQTLMRGRMMAR
ncbi:MAG: hypothetical protein ACTSU5_00300 [Promethearchaeota archaeon]